MVLGAIGLGLGLVGGLVSARGERRGQRRAAGEQRRNTERGLGFLAQGQRSIESGFSEASGFLNNSLGTVQRGVLDALAALDDGFASEVRRVIDERAVLQANLDQDLTSRGLGNSTAAVNFHRALRSDTQRAIADTQAQFAGARSQTFLQGAGAVANVQGAQANLAAQRGTALAGVDGQRAALIGGAPVPVINNQAWAGQLGGLALQGASLIQGGRNNAALVDAINGRGGGSTLGGPAGLQQNLR